MKALLIATCLTLVAAPMAIAKKCIPAGGAQGYGVMLPALGPSSGSGLPTSAAWTTVPAKAWDADTWSGNDFVGTGQVNGNWLSVDIQNQGGNLISEHGSVLEGGLEGACIELYFVRGYTYTTIVTECVTVSVGGFENEFCTATEVSFPGTYTSPVQKVCPC